MRSLPTTFMQKKRHNIWILLMSLALFLLAAVLSLLLGSAAFSPAELWKAAAGGADAAVLRIFLHVRLPRTLACILAGSALAVSGVIIQSVLANPLAGPNIIGVNAGAGFFAVLCAAFLPHWPAAVPTAAFLGALAAMLLVYAIARATRASRIALVLSGVAVSSVLSAGVDAVVTLLPDTLTGASSFRIGGVSGAAMKSLAVPGAYILAGILLAFSLHCEMDLLSSGRRYGKKFGTLGGKISFSAAFDRVGTGGRRCELCGAFGICRVDCTPRGAFFCRVGKPLAAAGVRFVRRGFCLCLRCAGPDSVCAVRAAGGDCHVFFGRPVFSVSSHPAQRGADRQWLN